MNFVSLVDSSFNIICWPSSTHTSSVYAITFFKDQVSHPCKITDTFIVLNFLIFTFLYTKIKKFRTIIVPVILHGCDTWKLRVSENMVLRRIFGPRRDEVTGEWRTLHIEEINGLYSPPNIVRVIKSRRMRWAGHVARRGRRGGRIGSWWGNRSGRDRWGDLGVDGWIILGWISRRWVVGMWTGLG